MPLPSHRRALFCPSRVTPVDFVLYGGRRHRVEACTRQSVTVALQGSSLEIFGGSACERARRLWNCAACTTAQRIESSTKLLEFSFSEVSEERELAADYEFSANEAELSFQKTGVAFQRSVSFESSLSPLPGAIQYKKNYPCIQQAAKNCFGGI